MSKLWDSYNFKITIKKLWQVWNIKSHSWHTTSKLHNCDKKLWYNVENWDTMTNYEILFLSQMYAVLHHNYEPQNKENNM